MSFDWRYGIAAVVALWLIGAACSGLLLFFVGARSANYNPQAEWKGRLLVSFGLSFFLWPFLMPAAVSSFFSSRRLCEWLVYADHESSAGQWTLSDGTEFLASANGGQSGEVLYFLADYMTDEIRGEIQFRLRMIAPSSEPFSDWKPMSFTAQPATDEADDDPDDSIPSRFEAELTLPRGKYAVEFRAQNRAGAFEERTGVTMIVADDSDYA